MAGPEVRPEQIIRAIGPWGYGDTASATGIRRTALAAALQYRCLAAVLQEPVCWRTRWVRTGVLGAETGSPASRLLQFRVVSGLVGLASAGKATVSYRGIERVSRRACIGGTGFSRESDRCHTAEFSVLRLASSRLKPVPLWNAFRPVERVQLEVDAERPGMHTHAERGHDQMPGTGSVGAGLLANAVGQNRECWLPKPVRQQAGSYSSRRAWVGGTGFSREAVALLLIRF